MKPTPVVIKAAVAVAAAWLTISVAQAVNTGLPAASRMPTTDGGVIFAPPKQFAPVLLTCGTSQKSIVVQVPDDTDLNPGSVAVRIGDQRVRATTGHKNGIRLTPGQSISLDVADGITYAVSEAGNDAGVALGVFCVYGGP